MSKRPPHGGKPPSVNRRTLKKPGPKREALIIEDIDAALRRIWQRKKRAKT